MKQGELVKNNDNLKCIQIGSTVAVQKEDSRPWMHSTVTEEGNDKHNG